MIKSFEYVFYRSYLFYKNVIKEPETAAFSGVLVVGITQYINLLTVYALVLKVASMKTPPFQPVHGIFFAFITISINYLLLFSKEQRKKILNRWKNEPQDVKRRRGWWLIAYFVLTFLLLIIISALK